MGFVLQFGPQKGLEDVLFLAVRTHGEESGGDNHGEEH
jgi:hypothetical protein